MVWLAAAWFVGQVPLQATLMIALFWAALVHPERIANRSSFRLSAMLLGISFVASVAVPMVIVLAVENPDKPPIMTTWYLLLACFTLSLLTFLSFILGLGSVMGKPAIHTRERRVV